MFYTFGHQAQWWLCKMHNLFTMLVTLLQAVTSLYIFFQINTFNTLQKRYKKLGHRGCFTRNVLKIHRHFSNSTTFLQKVGKLTNIIMLEMHLNFCKVSQLSFQFVQRVESIGVCSKHLYLRNPFSWASYGLIYLYFKSWSGG